MLTACLGIAPDALNNRLIINKPHLPSWLDNVQFNNVKVGNTLTDLNFRRMEEDTLVNVSKKNWDINVLISIKVQEINGKIETGLTINQESIMVKISIYIIRQYMPENKEFFRKRGIPFDFVDFDLASEGEQDRIAAEMVNGTCDTGFPFVRS